MIREKHNLKDLKPYEPGKPIDEVKRELGLKKIIKLASNENPFGPSLKAVKAIKNIASKVHLYPDGFGYDLKVKLAERHNVDIKNIVLGNGSNEIIELLIKAYMHEGDELIAADPSFLVYPLAAKSANVKCINVPLLSDFKHDLETMLSKITNKTKLIFICNPNNPTGTMMTREEIAKFMERVPDNILTVFDEAYYEFAKWHPDYPNSVEEYLFGDKPVAIIRTFSKSYGLAGLRIGYAIVPEEIAITYNKVRQPFNTNAVAQAAAVAALDDEQFLLKTVNNNRQQYEYITEELRNMGLSYAESLANFILINVEKNADEVFHEMLKLGVIVRSMASYKLKTYIRVTIGKPEENRIFIQVLKKVLRR